MNTSQFNSNETPVSSELETVVDGDDPQASRAMLKKYAIENAATYSESVKTSALQSQGYRTTEGFRIALVVLGTVMITALLGIIALSILNIEKDPILGTIVMSCITAVVALWSGKSSG